MPANMVTKELNLNSGTASTRSTKFVKEIDRMPNGCHIVGRYLSFLDAVRKGAHIVPNEL